MTEPIRITDDHKTDKAKPRLEMSRAPPVPRSRKGTSAMSSRRTSPAASDDSLQSFSEAGAVVQKQMPHSRGKPYERPTVARHHSNSSIHSAASMSALPNNNFPDVPAASAAEWPNVNQTLQQAPPIPTTTNYNTNNGNGNGNGNNINLRRPFPGTMTPLNADTLSFTSSNPPSVHSSAVQSPISLQPALEFDDFPSELNTRFSALGQTQTQPMSFPNTHNPMLFDNINGFGGDGGGTGLDAFNTQDPFSASSYSSSFASDHSGLGLYNADSVFSDSGLRPESTDDENDQMMNYLNIPDGGDSLSQPFSLPGPDASAPAIPAPMAGVSAMPFTVPGVPPPMAAPQQPMPMIASVVPPNGPMSGGPEIAILGTNMPASASVLFGGRPAETKSCTPFYIQCILPPGLAPGPVEVTVQGYGRQPVASLFTYDGVTKEAMELALKVQGQYPMDPNRPMPSSGGAPQNGPSPPSWSGPNATQEQNLQGTLTNFLASIDQHSPGSLRHSGAINTRNATQQTLLHLATILGYDSLLRRLIVFGAQLDIQDINGFSPLAFAAYSGRIECARVLIEAGATYDLPTNLGELPLDLAKISGDTAVEHLLLSAVWSTRAMPPAPELEPSLNEVEDDLEDDLDVPSESENNSELDDDNPSDGSDDEDEVDAFIDRPPRRRRSRHKGKRPHIVIPDDRSMHANAPDSVRRTPSTSDFDNDSGTESIDPLTGPAATGVDSPPPYSPASWLDRIQLTEHWKLPLPLVPQPIASMFHANSSSSKSKNGTAVSAPAEAGWVTLPVPAPSWETLQRMTSPEEVKLFTQAMAAAALNAVVQSGATTSMDQPTRRPRERRKKRRSSGSSGTRPRHGDSHSPGGTVVKQVKSESKSICGMGVSVQTLMQRCRGPNAAILLASHPPLLWLLDRRHCPAHHYWFWATLCPLHHAVYQAADVVSLYQAWLEDTCLFPELSQSSHSIHTYL